MTTAATIRRFVGTARFFFSGASPSSRPAGASNSFVSALIRLTRIIAHFSRARVARPVATPKTGAISW